jgi:predicted nucleotidyltransferase component of viral defense system
MRLHENKGLFKNAVFATAQQKGLSDIYVEKDYWVTFALHTIFTNEIGTQTVFKGGTALSKCFNIIERFSEDIDLVVLRNVGESDNQMTNKIKKIGKCIESVLPKIAVPNLTQKRGMNRKTAHSYEKMYEGDFGQVRDLIVLEATWFGHYEPYTTTSIQSYIAEMMTANNQTALIKDYNLQPFAVQVLTKERTLCEKIMSLVRFSFTENPIFDLNNKVRHIYDIHKLLQNAPTNQFFNSEEFDTLLLKVANDDVKSFRNNNAWLSNHPLKALIFSDTLNTWNQIKQTYNSDFKALVFGELPNEKDMLNTLNYISNRLASIKWTIV